MAELTPSARYIVSHLLGSLREMAYDVNRDVTLWSFGARGRAFNIVAVDFIRSTGVVDAAIFNNLLRGTGMSACDAYRRLAAAACSSC
ncbi:hypothetical protein ONE63_003433 [Megalurothrips usitatus]|uniref:Uncharacterized protein n=1 Tax=Megalurothrips usitatus TaxID=439358 RepID=A0AAV7XBI3_9NEOP|nr:hypothetical protein ONE63_003433 [Megalurothrips usitatus]